MTSQRAVEKLKNILRTERAGHTGTLDPFATGVLPVCINGATKAIPYLDESFKEYEATLKLGVETDTMDETGSVVNESAVPEISEKDVLNSFARFMGETTQVPPMFSAIKKNGVRLYKLARKGMEVERTPRPVVIETLELLELNPPYIKFFVRCSRGTYVRVLASDIAGQLGCVGHLTDLKRVRSGIFCLKESQSLEDLKSGNIKLVSLGHALSHIKEVNVPERAAARIKDGKQITKTDLDLPGSIAEFDAGDKIRVSCGSEIICIAEALVSSYNLCKLNDRDVALKLLRVF